METNWKRKWSCFLGRAGIAAIFLAGVLRVDGAVVLVSATNPANGHVYHVVTGEISPENPLGGLSWSEAESFARSLAIGGDSSHLLSITTAQEEEWIKDQFSAPGSDFSSPFHLFWTCLTDREEEGIFGWESGELSPYRNWTGGSRPPDPDGTEDFVYFANTNLFEPLMMRGQINDHVDERVFSGIIPFSAIVEVVPVPEPTTLMLGVCALPMILRRGRGLGV